MKTRWLIAIFLFSHAANAQERTGFAIDRHEPAERGSMFFVGDTLDLRGRLRPAAGATLVYAYKPLVVQDANGEERFALVRHQTVLHPSASLVLFDRARVALDVPVAIYQDGEDGIAAREALRAASAPALGDVRVAADVRLAGRYGDVLTLAAGMRAWLPTGLRSQFTSDGSLRAAPQVLASGQAGAFVWTARAAVVLRARDEPYAGSPLGSELQGALAAGLRTRDDRLVVGPEIQASSLLAEPFAKKTTPVEILGGAHWEITSGVRIAVAAGLGLTQGFGSPRFRGLVAIEGVPRVPAPVTKEQKVDEVEPIPPEDADGDEVWDTDDACPTIPGERTSDPMTNGCPPNTPRPLAVMTKDQIRIGEEIRFGTDSAELVGDSDAVLAAVKKILDEHPEIRKVRVEGHTDAVGDPSYNDDLSARRAASVTRWLEAHGVDPSRLESQGFGSRRPLDTNDTEAGRARNRRVVFTIVERAPARR